MDAQQFLAEFGHIANAPGGVARLKDLVLQLGIQGNLLAETGPRTRTSLGELGKWGSGGTPPKTHVDYYGGDIPWLVIGDLTDGLVTSAVTSISRNGLENSSAKLIPPGSLLVGMYGSIGKLGITTFECATNQAIAHCVVNEKLAFIRYLFIFIRANRSFLFSQGKGLAQQNISQTILKATLIDLPALEEQTRIVAKVDELMALCDKLEDEQQKRRKLQNTLRQATLKAVAKAQSAHELQTSWARLEANFGCLFTAPEDVAELRGLILDMAMRGYLVHQDNTEESATTLCDDVEHQKRELSKIKKLKLHKSLSQIGEDEIPFIAPKGWKWIRLGQIVELINGDRSKSYPNKDEYVSVGVPWINTGHIEPDGTLTKHHMNFISREKFESLSSGKIEPGDLVYCLRGATFGKTAFVTPYKEGAIASSLVIIRPINASLSRYLYYYLISPLGRSQIYRFDNGTAQPNLSANSVGLFAYPLPPLNEQTRITDKIEQLMRTCDSLELQIRDSCEVAARLAAATIASLTGIAIEQEEDELVKVPQTELISRLRLGQAPSVKAQAPLASLLARQNGELSAQDLWQRYGGEIDAFYAQLKTEVAHGWIEEPAVAEVREKSPEVA